MKIKIDRKVFAQALSEVAPFAPQKAPIVTLKNAKITTKGNRMKIEANDTQCSMVKYIELAECDQDGSFLIDIAELNKFISKVKGDFIEIFNNDNTVVITYPKGTAEFQSSDVNDFPTFKTSNNNKTSFVIDGGLLSDAIQKGKGFIMTDNLRPQMCAIYAYVTTNEFGFCSTDTRKLIHGHYPCTLNIENAANELVSWYIIPSIFNAIVNACKKADLVYIQVDNSHVSYRIDNTIINTVQPKGKFPDYKRVIPQNSPIECTVEKTDLLETLSRIALFSDNSQCAKLDVSNMDITASVDNLELMRKSTEHIMHGGCNGDVRIGVNVIHAQTCVGVFNDGEICMKMENESRPILFTQRDNENIQVVCMPMQLTN